MIYTFNGHKPEIGNGTYVSEGATIIGDVKIGERCYIGPGAVIRGDFGRIEIGSETAVEENIVIHSQPGETVVIGNKVTFGHGAIIHAHEIGDWVVVGMGAVLSLDSVIGADSIVAEGAVVKRGQKVPPKVMVAGAPAKVIREIAEEDTIRWTKGKQSYVDVVAMYLAQGMGIQDT